MDVWMCVLGAQCGCVRLCCTLNRESGDADGMRCGGGVKGEWVNRA